MANWEAVQLAIHMTEQPALIRAAREAPLPRGMPELLELACGDPRSLAAAATMFSISEPQLRAAATFFVEQILFHHRANSYRTLGGEADTTSEDLRRNMALLMKWLHPDAGLAASPALDRSIFVNRVTEAWEHLKSQDRRRAYDSSIAAGPASDRASQNARKPKGSFTRNAKAPRLVRLLPADPSPEQSTNRSVLRRIRSFWGRRP